MFTTNPQAQPGVYGPYTSQPRTLIYSDFEKVQRVSVPLVIDGTNSSWATNSPYTWLLPAGMLFGRNSTSKKYAPSVLGQTTANYVSGGTTVTTDANTAAYLASRLGASGTFNITGPAAASTAAASTSTTLVTYSAVNTTTGAITVTNIGANVLAGAWIQPIDGSQTVLWILGDDQGVAVVDGFFNRIDAQTGQMLSGGGCINTGYIVNYPTDPGFKLYVKAALRANASGMTFLDDFTG